MPSALFLLGGELCVCWEMGGWCSIVMISMECMPPSEARAHAHSSPLIFKARPLLRAPRRRDAHRRPSPGRILPPSPTIRGGIGVHVLGSPRMMAQYGLPRMVPLRVAQLRRWAAQLSRENREEKSRRAVWLTRTCGQTEGGHPRLPSPLPSTFPLLAQARCLPPAADQGRINANPPPSLLHSVIGKEARRWGSILFLAPSPDGPRFAF